MERKHQDSISRKLAIVRRRRAWIIALCVLCVGVTAGTFAILSKSVQTYQGELVCELAEHTHAEECYGEKQICDSYGNILECIAVPHAHSAACYDGESNLICGQATFFLHTHEENCYDAQGQLACTLSVLKEHTHSASCFESVEQLICDISEEDETHVHDSECYEVSDILICKETEVSAHTHNAGCYDSDENLICEKLAVLVHRHDDACFAAQESEHEHTEACFAQNALICEQQAHVHGEDCYAAPIDLDLELEPSNGQNFSQNSGGASLMDDEDEPPTPWSVGDIAMSGITGDCTYSLEVLSVNLTDPTTPVYTYKLTISGNGAMADYTSTAVGNENAPPWRSSGIYDRIVEVVIEPGVTRIGNYGFYYLMYVEKMELADTVTSIGEGACEYLAYYGLMQEPIDLRHVEEIESEAFYQSLVLPEDLYLDSIIELGYLAFYYTRGVSNVYLGESVREIGLYAFYNVSLNSINIPKGVEEIGIRRYEGEDAIYGVIATSVQHIYFYADLSKLKARLTSGAHTIHFGTDLTVFDGTYVLSTTGNVNIDFEGPNTFTAVPNTFAQQPLPMKNLDNADKLFVDENGVLYTLNETEKTAKIAYIPAEITEITIPASIVSEGENYAVTGVASQLALLGLQSITFAAPAQIIDMAQDAFTNNKSLISVNGETTVEGAAALFTSLETCYAAFMYSGLSYTSANLNLGTAGSLLSYTHSGSSGDKVMTVELGEGASYPFESGKFTMLTGREFQLLVSVAGVNTESLYFRLYIEQDSTRLATFPDWADGNVSVAGNQITLVYPNVAGVRYMEWQVPAGSTCQIPLTIQYPAALTNGGSVRVWGQILTESERDTQGKGIVDTASAHIGAQWSVKKEEYSLNTTNSTSGSALTLVEPGGNIAKFSSTSYTSKTYTLAPQGLDEEFYGKDPVIGLTYKVIYTLPTGMYWDTDLIAAVNTGEIIKSGYYFRIMKNGVSTIITYATGAGGSPTAKDCYLEGGKLVFEWYVALPDDGVFRDPTTALTLYTYYTFWYMNLSTFNAAVMQTIEQTVQCTLNYKWSGLGSTYAQANGTILTAESGNNTSIYKTEIEHYNGDTKTPPIYGGMGRAWNIRFVNNGVMPINQLDFDDTLLAKSYMMTGEDMQRFFDDPIVGRAGKITIRYADMYPTSNPTSIWNLGSGVGSDGSTSVTLNGYNTDGGTATYTNGRIEIAWYSSSSTYLVVRCYDSGGTQRSTYNVGSTQTYKTIDEALRERGLLVDAQTQWELDWQPGASYSVPGASEINFPIYAHVKTDHMRQGSGNSVGYIAAASAESAYNRFDYMTYNRAYMYYYYKNNSGGTTYAGKNVYDYSSTGRAIPGEFKIWLENKSELTESIYNYEAKIEHFGTHANEYVPFEMCTGGPMRLLVPVSENVGASWTSGLSTVTDGGTDYYVLDKAGTYSKVWLGEYGTGIWGPAICADTITVDSSGRANIQWYLLNLPGGEWTRYLFIKTINVAQVSDETPLECSIWLNDRSNQQVYQGWKIVRAEKQIPDKIVSNGTAAGTDAEELVDRLPVHEGETVVFRVGLYNPFSMPLTAEVGEAYFTLPDTFGNFTWQAAQISIQYQIVTSNESSGTDSARKALQGAASTLLDADGDTDTERGELTPTGTTYPWTVITVGGSRRVQFTVPIEVQPGEQIYFYISLTFPDGTTWSNYTDDASTVYTYWNAGQEESKVQLDLSKPSYAFLQKNVMLTATHPLDVAIPSSPYTAYPYWFPRSTRSLYSEYGAEDVMVIYGITLYNKGADKLYINPIYDILPEGVTYNYCYLYGAEESTNNTYNATPITDSVNSPFYYQTGYSRKDYTAAKLALWQHATVNDPLVTYPAFIVRKSGSSNEPQVFTVEVTNQYDSVHGKYYLLPNQAVTFAVYIRVPYYQRHDVLKNQVVMAFDDFMDAGVSVPEGVTAHVKDVVGIEEENNGSKTVISGTQASALGLDGSQAAQWLSSDVSLVRAKPIPGTVKRAYTTQATIDSAPSPYQNNANPGAYVNWQVRLHNTGEFSNTIGYTLTDTVEAPYVFEGTVSYHLYNREEAEVLRGTNIRNNVPGTVFTIVRDTENLDSIVIKVPNSATNETSHNLTRGGAAVNFYIYIVNNASSFGGYISVRIYVNEDGNEVLEITPNGPEMTSPAHVMSLPYGYQAVWGITAHNPTNSYALRSFGNTAMLTLPEEYDETQVVTGMNVTDSMGKNLGVASNAFISTAVGGATNALITVAEVSDLSNSAGSEDSQNYIIVNPVSKDLLYTLEVQNSSTISSIEDMTVICNLPQVGDHFTFNDTAMRGSQFKVNFAATPQVTVRIKDSLGSYTTVPSQYLTVDFSDKTEYTAGDRDSSSTDGWYNSSMLTENSRSLRVHVLDETALKNLYAPGSTLEITFHAETDNPSYGAIAYNGFAYHFRRVGSLVEMEAAPNKVGVRTQTVPLLRKNIRNGAMGALELEQEATFTFLIHEGTALTVDYSNPNAVSTALAGKKASLVQVTVSAGASTAQLSLLDMQEYTAGAGVWTATAAEWIWTAGDKYTIVEIGMDSGFRQTTWNNAETSKLTFTYTPAAQNVLTVANLYEPSSIKMTKLIYGSTIPLAGTWFGLYSLLPTDVMSQADYDALALLLDTAPAQVIATDAGEAHLTAAAKTGEDGVVLFNMLSAGQYFLVELQATNGYRLDDTPIFIDLPEGTNVVDNFENIMAVTLPKTGGSGNLIPTICFGMMILAAFIWLRKKDRKLSE